MAVSRNRHLPAWLENAPELMRGLEQYYKAYWRLTADRLGGPDTFIPWTAIHRYCEVYLYDGEDADFLHYAINQMDIAFIKFRNEKIKISQSSNSKANDRIKRLGKNGKASDDDA